MPKLTPSATDCRPIVDGRVLPDTPRNLLASGRVKIRPIMTGVVTEEWTRHIGMFLEDLFAKRPELGELQKLSRAQSACMMPSLLYTYALSQ
jgi:Carboxylesterase family